ncbi:MAG: glycoside hydrolase family 99-like domain-containing protein [Microgenomates group bacterium]
MLEFGTYFYPNSTRCPIRSRRASDARRPITDETQLVQTAPPRFDGHQQPHTYCLGNREETIWDDAEQTAMAKQVEIARQFGIDYFVFLTYIANSNGQTIQELQAPLDQSFLKLDPSSSIPFSLMMCLGSGARSIIPIYPGDNEQKNYPLGTATAQSIVDSCVRKYWNQPHYRLRNGKPELTLYSPLSGQQVTETVDALLTYSWETYQIEPYVSGVLTVNTDGTDYVRGGVDALTGYLFLPDFTPSADPVQHYDSLLAQRITDWHKILEQHKIPFIPPAVVGFDASPRFAPDYTLADMSTLVNNPGQGRPMTPIIPDSTPERFTKMLNEAARYINTCVPADERRMIICAWSEIAEGCALLPQVIEGQVDFSYLEALRMMKEQLNTQEMEDK